MDDSREIYGPDCDLCSEPAIRAFYLPLGCTCMQNKVQRRCLHHENRLRDTYGGIIHVIEDYTIDGFGKPQYLEKIQS